MAAESMALSVESWDWSLICEGAGGGVASCSGSAGESEVAVVVVVVVTVVTVVVQFGSVLALLFIETGGL